LDHLLSGISNSTGRKMIEDIFKMERKSTPRI